MITLLLLLAVLATTTTSASATSSSQPITAIYAIGDSVVDPGNNNYVPTALARADHAPYGKHFPNQVATGRFSDGLLATDFLANYLGLKQLIPAYADPTVTDQDLFTGVSFGSAGAGLDDLTNKLVQAIDLPTQVNNFEQAIARMVTTGGVNKTSWTVKNAMFLISVGSNDLFFNYFDLPTRALLFSPSSYSDFLLCKLQAIIQLLYNLGARRFMVVGLLPLGCLPIQVSLGSIIPGPNWLQRVCVDQQNSVAQIYNLKLQNLLNQLESHYSTPARFVYGDFYTPTMDMIKHPQNYGFKVTLKGCCGTGTLEFSFLCVTPVPICPNSSTYLFWDSFHPTQAAYKLLADALETYALPKILD